MLVVLIALYAVALLAPLIFRLIPRGGFYVLALAPALAFVWQLTVLPQAIETTQGTGPALLETWTWIEELGIQLSFRMDALSAFMSLIVLGVGAAVLLYCARYFEAEAGDPKNGIFGAQLLAFAATMFGLVTTNDLMVLFIFWEITSILSFLLIGYAGHRIFARRSALTSLVVTTFGGLAMLAGLIMLGQAADTYQISEILAAKEQLLSGAISETYLAWMIWLILLGALSKSAQVPFHFWLPAAMAAPTPVSAYLHSAAMVKAGVFVVARLAPLFATETIWIVMVLGVGMWTMLVGGWRALRQTDIKLVLAYGTVSQLGFLMIINGIGTPQAAVAGLMLLLAHSLFKAPLFMVVGVIDKKTGTRDLHKLSGLWRNAPRLFAVSIVAAASMAGVPLTLGFVSKEMVFEAAGQWGSGLAETAMSGATPSFWHAVAAWSPLVVMVLGAVLTVAYSARFLWGAFADKTTVIDGEIQKLEDTAIGAFVGVIGRAAATILASLSVIFGIFPALVARLPLEHGRAIQAADPDFADHVIPPVAAFHGFNTVLLISLGILAAGLLLFWARRPVARVQDAVPAWIDANAIYRYLMRKLDELGVWVTGRTQRGDLSQYLFIILLMMLAGPLLVMIWPTNADSSTPSIPNVAFLGDTIFADSWAVVVLGVLMILAMIAALRARKRFMTVLLVSVTGYGVAGIFALQGSPDLALTQLLVESIVLVAMVLGLRVLPKRIKDDTSHSRKWARALLGIGFGAVMMWVAATAMTSRVVDPISLAMPELAYNEGGGSNIVNVTLVDIRAWDTFGEITVLAAAATGVASLVFIAQRDSRRKDLSMVKAGSVGRYFDPAVALNTAELSVVRDFTNVTRNPWLAAGPTLAPERRSLIFEVVARLTFHPIMLLSVYLLIAGHNVPGGGFAGGLLAGIAITIRYLAGGRFELDEAMPISPGIILGTGLAIAAATGLFPLFIGGEVFQGYDVLINLPVLGEIHFASAMIFDIGVYLVVIGLVVDVLRALGAEVDRRHEIAINEAAGARARQRAAIHAQTTTGRNS